MADFVVACEADPARWRDRWEAVRRELEAGGAPAEGVATGSGVATADLAGPADPVDESVATGAENVAHTAVTAQSSRRRRSRAALAAVAAILAAMVLAGGGFVMGRATASDVDPVTIRAIEIQNKVALGPASLVEDRTPAYLSSLPIAYCGAVDRGCKVAGTEMGSGAGIVATCVVHGQQMWNYDLSDPQAQDNPDRVGSDLWYRASFPDGRVGYVAEVYLTASSRGGLGLPPCDPTR